MNAPHRLIVIMCLALGLQTSAQNYRPFPTDNAFWSCYYLNVDIWSDNTYSQVTVHYLAGDTVVNGITYQVVRLNEQHWFSHNVPPLSSSQGTSNGTLASLIRQDTIVRTVYIYDLDDETEYLFYDFSVGVGLYPATYATDMQEGWEVTAVDSVLLADGYHRRWIFYDDHSFIEGVGRTWGFPPVESQYLGFVQTLRCQSHNDVQIYTGPDYTGPGYYFYCGQALSVTEDQVAPAVHLSPSPAFDQCQLTNAPPNAAFIVRGMDGRGVLTGRCSNSGQAVIDVTGIPAAMYVLEVNDGAQRVREKFLKQ